MELWDTLIVTQDLYGGQQYCENVTQWSPTLIKKRVLGCEFCSEVNNTLPFWKEVLLVSVHVIVLFFFFHFWIKRQPSVHHVPRRWSNVFLNAFSVIFQTFSNFKLESLPKYRRLDSSVAIIMALIKGWDEHLSCNILGWYWQKVHIYLIFFLV